MGTCPEVEEEDILPLTAPKGLKLNNSKKHRSETLGLKEIIASTCTQGLASLLVTTSMQTSQYQVVLIILPGRPP